MIILCVHNFYRQPGGEDIVFNSEVELLKRNGHTVVTYQRNNNELVAKGDVLWSQKSYNEVRYLIQKNRPDIAHFHNTFLAISPAAYHACQAEGVPVIQTLHNFRLICPGALLMRNERPCEDCMGRKIAWPGVRHACWRGSRPGSGLVAVMLGLHRALGTWQHKVDRYIALSDFSRQKFIQGGLPGHKIAVKPNFLPDSRLKRIGIGEFALFIGRLSIEKGIRILLKAWQRLPNIPLYIAGDGPLREECQQFIESELSAHTTLVGYQERDYIYQLLQQARFLIVPSTWYENFPVVLLEAFSFGIPLVVPAFGNLGNLVKDGYTGLHFNPGDAHDLAQKATWLWQHPEESARMGQNARREYEEKYTPEVNYRQLMGIYEQVLAKKI